MRKGNSETLKQEVDLKSTAPIKETPLKIKAVFDSKPVKQGTSFNGHIIQAPKHLGSFSVDAVVITSFQKQEETYRHIRDIAGDRIAVKKLFEP